MGFITHKFRYRNLMDFENCCIGSRIKLNRLRPYSVKDLFINFVFEISGNNQEQIKNPLKY